MILKCSDFVFKCFATKAQFHYFLRYFAINIKIFCNANAICLIFIIV